MRTLGLYIHIPFCIRKCNYCDFYSTVGTEDDFENYIAMLNRNISVWSDKLCDRIVDTIYIGGGTPSVLGTDRLCNILSAVNNNFNVASDTEITIEMNPSSNDLLDFKVLKSCGVNRISMGLQSSNNEQLGILGRLHSATDVLNTLDRLNRSGIDNYSLDVMMGIPKQTMESLSETLDFCINNGASHISTYMLKIEKNTPFYINADNYTFADDDMMADMYEMTCDKLRSSGFRHYEISNFCKDNKISKHNFKYWTLDDYLGIGPSAHSMIDKKRFYYPRSITDFDINNIRYESNGNTPEEYIMLSLRTDLGINFAKQKELFGISPTDSFISVAKKLEKLGLVILTDESLVLTEKGFLLSNTIISQLLSTGI